jgi:predicted O-methyltransferase YrrM
MSALRYKLENPNFKLGEAIILYSMIRYAQPKRIIEIGAGFSSAAMVDVNELFFNNEIEYTIIEPYPDLLHSLLRKDDISRIKILRRQLQVVEPENFELLEENDILFIDSSHVAKVGSDVNHIFFEILPRLKKGVFIHFHDIGYPFEYPKEWIYQGRAWNEAYLLRAFLQFNDELQILFFNSYLRHFHAELLREFMPLCVDNPGTSLWLLK